MDTYPVGSAVAEVKIARASISAIDLLRDDPLLEDGVRLHMTGFSSEIRFLDKTGELLGSVMEDVISFSLHIPLPDTNPDTPAILSGLEVYRSNGSELKVFISRNVDEGFLPYRTLVLSDEYGSIEVFLGD